VPTLRLRASYAVKNSITTPQFKYAITQSQDQKIDYNELHIIHCYGEKRKTGNDQRYKGKKRIKGHPKGRGNSGSFFLSFNIATIEMI